MLCEVIPKGPQTRKNPTSVTILFFPGIGCLPTLDSVNSPQSSKDKSGYAYPNSFRTTHWTIVLSAADTAVPGADEGLEKLYRTYWSPVYAYVRRQGHKPDDA